MPQVRYTAAQKAAHVSKLQASAARSETGEPVWSAVSKETGVHRETLKRWWAKLCQANEREDATPSAEVFTLPNVDTDAPLVPVEEMTEADLFAWQFEFQRTCAVQARAHSSFGAIPKLLEGMERSFRELDAIRERKRREGLSALSDGERAIQFRRLVRDMSPRDGLVVAEALRKRGLA